MAGRKIIMVLWILLAAVFSGPQGRLSAESDIRHQIDQEVSKVSGRKSVDLLKSLRRFSNKNTMVVIRALSTRKLDFGDLIKETGLTVSLLNHTLTEMKNTDLVMQNDIDKRYALTKYCAQLLGALRRLKAAVEEMPEEDLFASTDLCEILNLNSNDECVSHDEKRELIAD